MPLLAQLCGETGRDARRFRALMRYREGFFTFCINGGGCIGGFLSGIHALFKKGQCVGFHRCPTRDFFWRNHNWLWRSHNHNWLRRNHNCFCHNHNRLWYNHNCFWR